MSKSFRKDLTGRQFGRLTVLKFVPNEKEGAYWLCKCDCGNEVVVLGSYLKNGHTKSCGCLKIKRFIKHNLANTRLNKIWSGMKDRCYNPNNNRYKDYGERGIRVCDKWVNDFKAFYDWAMANGYADKLSIDRINVNGNYEPANCRFTDTKTQGRNRRNNVIVEYHGEKICLAEAAEMSGINKETFMKRYQRGDRGERLFRPIKSSNY